MNLCKVIENNIYNELIRRRVCNLLASSNINAEQLAYRSGIAKSEVSAIISGKRNPKGYTIVRICAGLGIYPKDFYSFKELEDYTNTI